MLEKKLFRCHTPYWDVSNVLDTSDMFNGASLFNQSLEDWDVSSVKNMSDMFIKSPMTNNLPSWYVP